MKTMKWVNTIAFLAMVTVNILAELLPFGGKTTAQISDAYPNLFTPTGLTFSIWGVIYLLVGIYVLYQWGLLGHAEEAEHISSEIGILFAVSCILNILWLICWHRAAIGWSVLFMIGLLAVLIMIQFTISSDTAGITQRISVNIGFDVYYGWIIAATIANISAWLVKVGWDRFGLSESFWTTAVVIIGAAIGLCIVLIERNRLAALSLCWAYLGILTKHLSAADHAGRYPVIISALILGIIGILTAIVAISAGPTLRPRERAQEKAR